MTNIQKYAKYSPLIVRPSPRRKNVFESLLQFRCSKSFLVQENFHTFVVFSHHSLDECNNDTKVNSMHSIFHYHLVNAEVVHYPKGIIQEMSSYWLANRFVMWWIRTRCSVWSIFFPLHHLFPRRRPTHHKILAWCCFDDSCFPQRCALARKQRSG